MSEEKTSTSEALLIQLGTDPTDIQDGVDMSRLGVIHDPQNVPESYRNWVYWDLCWRLLGDEFAKHLHDSGLNHSIAIGGRGRVDLIKGASVAQGGPVNTEADIVKPGWVTRNIIDRQWEDRERQRLGLAQKE